MLARAFTAAVGTVGACALLSGAAPTDARLDRSLDLSLARVSLLRVVEKMGEEAGMSLTAATADRGKRPFQAFTHGQPLKSVMGELARFVPTQPGSAVWEKVTIGRKPGYRLVEDLRSRGSHTALLRRLAAERAERLRVDLVTALRLADLSGEELLVASADKPEFAFFMPALKHSLHLLGALGSDKVSRLLVGQPVKIPFDDLSREQQNLVWAMVGKRRSRLSFPRPDGSRGFIEWDSERDLPKTCVTARLCNQPDRPGIQLFIPTLPGAGIGWPDTLHPPSVSERDRPEWMRKAYEKRDAAEKGRRKEWARKAAGDPELQKVVTLRHELDRPDPHHPGKTVRKLAVVEFVLEQIADQSGLSVIGDYDPCWDDYYSWQDFHRPGLRNRQYLHADLVKQPLWMALEVVESNFAITIEKHGKFLWIRSPRVPYAEIDGIDLLDDRPAPPPRGLPDDAATKS